MNIRLLRTPENVLITWWTVRFWNWTRSRKQNNCLHSAQSSISRRHLLKPSWNSQPKLCGNVCFIISLNDIVPSASLLASNIRKLCFIMVARVRYQDRPREICDGRSGIGTGFPPQYFSFPCQYHSTNAPHLFIHLPPTLYNVFLPVLQFPLPVLFYQCSILIHSSTTDAV
jgi:hypothetical protein